MAAMASSSSEPAPGLGRAARAGERTDIFGGRGALSSSSEPETAYWVPACAHTLPQQGDGHCKVPPAVNPMLDLPASFGCRSMGCSGSGSTGATGCARRCTAALARAVVLAEKEGQTHIPLEE